MGTTCCKDASRSISMRLQKHEFLLNELRDMQAALKGTATLNRNANYRPNFTNWSGNVETNNQVNFPKNDTDIQEAIKKARDSGGKVSVAGAGHSCSPCVCDNGEQATVLSLGSYSMKDDPVAPIPDFQVDPTAELATVNAGWGLDQFMCELGRDWPDFICEAQTAARIFTIGGIINMCTHGGCMKAGLIADTVKGLRIIDAQGAVQNVMAEEELRYYRMSFGAFGVITHVTMKLRKITELKLHSEKVDFEMTEEWCAEYFKDKIKWDGPLFQQFFLNFYEMKLYYGAWSESGDKRTKKDYPKLIDTRAGERGLGGQPVLPIVDELLNKMDVNYRKYGWIVRNLVKLSCEVPMMGWKLNEMFENDAFWLSSVPSPMPASHWVGINVPVDAPDTTNIYKMIKVSYDAFQATERAFDEGSHHYRPDVALEFRFVWSSDSYFAPIFSEKRHSQLYIAPRLATLNSNTYLSRQQMIEHDDDENEDLLLNQEFSKYYFDVEEGWMSIDERARPHLGLCFSFAPSTEDPSFYEPYNSEKMKYILSKDRKEKIIAKLNEKDPTRLFKNKFVDSLVAI